MVPGSPWSLFLWEEVKDFWVSSVAVFSKVLIWKDLDIVFSNVSVYKSGIPIFNFFSSISRPVKPKIPLGKTIASLCLLLYTRWFSFCLLYLVVFTHLGSWAMLMLASLFGERRSSASPLLLFWSLCSLPTMSSLANVAAQTVSYGFFGYCAWLHRYMGLEKRFWRQQRTEPRFYSLLQIGL